MDTDVWAEASAQVELPEGPRNSADLFSWPSKMLQRLQSLMPKNTITRNIQRIKQVVLSTSFSGVGTPEIASKMISSTFQQEGLWPSDRVELYGSCDFSQRSQSVLMCNGNCASLHLFTDVCSSVPTDIVNKLTANLREKQKSFHMASDSNKASARQKLEKEFHAFANELLSSTSMLEQSCCKKCQKDCPRFPKPYRCNLQGVLHVEVAGSPCIPFVQGGFKIVKKCLLLKR